RPPLPASPRSPASAFCSPCSPAPRGARLRPTPEPTGLLRGTDGRQHHPLVLLRYRLRAGRIPQLVIVPLLPEPGFLMRRIMIIGGPGTGKSTLARHVGERLGLPVVHLDRHYWSPGWVAPEAAEWRRRVAELAGAEAWVMDGNYSATFDLRLPHAQALI